MFNKICKGFAMGILIAILAIPVSLWNGLIFMITVGAVHGWLPAIPTAGYWTSVVIAYGLAVLSPLRASTDSK